MCTTFAFVSFLGGTGVDAVCIGSGGYCRRIASCLSSSRLCAASLLKYDFFIGLSLPELVVFSTGFFLASSQAALALVPDALRYCFVSTRFFFFAVVSVCCTSTFRFGFFLGLTAASRARILFLTSYFVKGSEGSGVSRSLLRLSSKVFISFRTQLSGNRPLFPALTLTPRSAISLMISLVSSDLVL